MFTATESLKRIQESTESIDNSKPQRFPEAANTGDSFRQGDVYVEKRGGVTGDMTVEPKPNAQLAPGTTKGSRHVLDSLDGVTMYRVANPTPLDGPVIETTCERTITHPEHGDLILPPGVYAITYQRAYADELRRVAD